MFVVFDERVHTLHIRFLFEDRNANANDSSDVHLLTEQYFYCTLLFQVYNPYLSTEFNQVGQVLDRLSHQCEGPACC